MIGSIFCKVALMKTIITHDTPELTCILHLVSCISPVCERWGCTCATSESCHGAMAGQASLSPLHCVPQGGAMQGFEWWVGPRLHPHSTAVEVLLGWSPSLTAGGMDGRMRGHAELVEAAANGWRSSSYISRSHQCISVSLQCQQHHTHHKQEPPQWGNEFIH